MAYFQVTSFYYDESTGNIFVQFAKNTTVSYEHLPEETPTDIYEAQIFLDAGTTLIGKSRPSSVDGTIQGGNFGRAAGSLPNATPQNPLEDAPE